MKKFLGLCILVLLLVAASGCTQPAKTPEATPAPTTVVTTQAPTPEPTPVPTTVATTVAPVTTEVPVANVTAPATTVVTTAATPKITATPSIKVTTIYIRNNTFVPKELTVLPGTGLTWINEDTRIHAIKTNPQSPFKFDSGDVIPTATFEYTYTADEGSYGYFDPYTNATGVIIVKKGESFAGIGTPLPTVQATTTG